MPSRSTKSARIEEVRNALADAETARRAGEHVAGKEAAQRALSLAIETYQPRMRASALGLLCIHELRLGDTEAAIGRGLEALPLLKRSKDAAERAHILCALTLAYCEVGLYTDAMHQATKAMDAARASGVPSLLSWAFNRAGLAHEGIGDHERGERCMLQGLEIARQIEGSEEMFSALNNLCSNGVEMSDTLPPDEARRKLEQALAFGEEALQLAEESGNPHREAVCLGNLGMVHARLGHYNEALHFIEREKLIAHKHGYRGMALSALSNRAHLERICGSPALAIDLYRRSLADTHDIDDRAMLIDMHSGLHKAHKAMGDHAQALAHHEQMLVLERAEMKQRLDTQARLLLHRLELEQAQADAQRAKLDAEVQRLRAAQLETENRVLAVKAQELGRHAMEDQLTGLANRRRVDHELPLQLEQARNNHSALCVGAVDLDHFKLVNDRHGHGVGDDVLRTVARVLLDNTRGSDLLARMGGEEFLVLFVGTPLAVARDICERLRHAVEAFDWAAIAPGLRVTISIGLCNATDGQDMRTLLERADVSLYAAKRAGRNRVEVAAA